MRRISLFILVLLLSACAAPSGDLRPGLVVSLPAATATSLPLVVAADSPASTDTASPEPVLATPTLLVSTPIPSATIFRTQIPTFTPTFDLTTTQTPLPTLDLPTQALMEPLKRSFVGLPTYPGDSQLGWMFRLDYDPLVWAQAEDNFGEFVLAHRDIPDCVITPWSGRGLPPDAQVEHEFRAIGSYYFDVSAVSVQGELKFKAYIGGDARVMTGFQVSFSQQAETCLADAETLLLTFRPLAATPTPEPTSTPELSPTP
jgi:hypothetical protein